MYSKQPQSYVHLRLPESQHRALKRIAKQRNVTVQHLIRSGVAAVTGEPDTLRKHSSLRPQGETTT